MSEAAIQITDRALLRTITVHQWISFGTPLLFWALMLIFPDRGGDWVWMVIGLLTIYFLMKPTAERVVWVLLPYLFSVGGASFSLAVFDISLRQLPSWVAWLSYIYIPIAVLVSFLIQPHWKGREIGLPILALTIVSLMSAVIHDSNPLSWFGWMLHFIRYPLLFLALINFPIKQEVLVAWVKTFIGLAYLQIPATIIQVLLWQVSFSDDIVGTMYGAQTSMMGLTVSIALSMHLAMILNTKNIITGFLLLPSLFIPLLLGAANYAIVISILSMIIIILIWGISFVDDHERIKVKMKKWVGILTNIAIIIVVGVLFTTFVFLSPERHELTAWVFGTIPSLSTIDAFIKPEYAAFGSRQMFIATTFQWFVKHPYQLWLGSLGPQVGLGSQGATFAQYLGQEGYYPLALVNMAMGFPPNMPQSNVQLPRVLLEVGLLGLGCFIWLYCIPLMKALKVRKEYNNFPFALGISEGFSAVWAIVALFSVFYIDSWRFDQTSFAFWVFAAVLWKFSSVDRVQR